jgi:hypothetical protein
MSLSKKIPLVMFLTSVFAIYSNTALADHGSMGFCIDTPSPYHSNRYNTPHWNVGQRSDRPIYYFVTTSVRQSYMI